MSFDYLLYDIIGATAALPGLLWFRTKRIYASEKAKEKIRGGALVISNHVGFFDPIYLMFAIHYRRHHFIATKELFDGKVKRFLFTKAFHCIEIDRDNFNMATFRKIVDVLKQGKIVSMFPEGHICKEQENAAFKSGMVLMALQSGCSIVPVYIKKREHFWQRQVAVIGEPVMVKSEIGIKVQQISEKTQYLFKIEKELENLVK